MPFSELVIELRPELELKIEWKKVSEKELEICGC